MTTGGLFGGIISGPSLDGISVVLLDVRGSDPSSVHCSVVGFVSAPYAPDDRARIRSAISTGGARDLALIDRDLEAMARLETMNTGKAMREIRWDIADVARVATVTTGAGCLTP